MLDLQPLLCPRSIAVVGASTSPDKVGGVPIRLLAELGYVGRVFPVNPGADTVQGLRAWRSIDAIGEPVDLAIVAVPAPGAPDVMAQLGQAGTRAAIVFTSGFAEVEGGEALQQALTAQARAHGVQLLGPNCLGAMNLRERMYATFSPIPLTGVPPVGEVGLVSQSGAFGAYAFALAREARLGLSHWVTTGNEGGVQVADVIEWLAHDPQTRVILAYMEGAHDGLRLRRALAAARDAGKPVVIAKVGTTAAGASAAQSHTASLAGEDAVYQAVFDEYGVHRAHTLEAFFRLGYTLARGSRPRQWASRSGLPADAVAPVAIVTVSGGVGIMMADSAETLGLPLPPMPAAAAQTLRTAIPFASTANPIDVTGQVVAQPQVFVDALANVARCGQYGSVAAFLAGGANAPRLWAALQGTVTELAADASAAPLLVSGVMDDDKRAWLEARGCLVFREPAHTMEAVAALARAAAMEAATAATGAAAGGTLAQPTTPMALATPVPAGASALSEAEAMACLAEAGVPVAPHAVARDADEAVRIAESLGFPVAVKLCSRHVLHKSDIGGVVLGLRDAEAVRAAFARVSEAASGATDAAGRPVPFEGAIVARMVRGWGEIMVGVRRDPVFGLVALAGIGGTAVEIFRQMAFGLAPLSRERARAMLEQSRAAALCTGHRGHPALDLDAVADVLVNVSRVADALGERLDTLEINPFIVGAEGLVAADAVITLR
ncbi:acetate--CoA ligase family protein [Cupriavidus agavae]|uniref:Acyl-CoA synthetase (NDP forming) n=1 Tax=Cupriavidus agavae TaxID=1001822 RepID=A0A4Q7RCL7_9BURK|nr:acetate--CoA ligase family protein [Cupriavidus agavae]RZT30895.1 acyl-CoA synthetase (NDP forming) [Cupriavidus agavae]